MCHSLRSLLSLSEAEGSHKQSEKAAVLRTHLSSRESCQEETFAAAVLVEKTQKMETIKSQLGK